MSPPQQFRPAVGPAEQPEFFLDEITTPSIALCEKVQGVGRIQWHIEDARTFTPVVRKKLPRRTKFPAEEVVDQEGARFLLTKKNADRSLAGYTGIWMNGEAAPTWLRHNQVDAARERLFGEHVGELRDEIRTSWDGAFRYRDAGTTNDGLGLRAPQIGALHAVLSHWTVSSEAATVVMPTGTGKTETMLSILLTARSECMLVAVPSKALRDQTAAKFRTLGILYAHRIIDRSAKRPVVGILEHQPSSEEDLRLFDRCNVVVAVIDSVAKGKAQAFLPALAAKCSHLVLDEAHHVAAASWLELKNAFADKPVVQFTATPFREDRSGLGGRQIYNYPLHRAQAEGFFKPITFRGIFEVDRPTADRRIAEEALQQLQEDLDAGWNHRLLARCRTIKRAQEVFEIYRTMAPHLNPVIVHSGDSAIEERLQDLRVGTSKVVVTVNMLAEGFDLPELKVAAVHDIFKSLAITLQFTGRFPRVGGDDVGEPTIIANTGLAEVANSLQALYDEDPDWNNLLARFSFERIEEQTKFDEFLRNARDLGDVDVPEDSIAARLNPQSLIPRFNAIVYRTDTFEAHRIRNGLERGHRFVRGWQSDAPPVTFFITRLIDQPKWTKSKGVEDGIWNLFTLYHDPDRRLLFIGSSASSATNHQMLADAVSGKQVQRFQGEEPFRVFAGIQRLLLQQVGLLSTGSRNHRYSMFAGADVASAVSRIVAGRAQKSNLFGSGFRDGGPIGLGCSKKGKIWGREFGSLVEWIEWCDDLGTLILNEDFDTAELVQNALVPERQTTLPARDPWFIDWPEQLVRRQDASVIILAGEKESPFHHWDLRLTAYDRTSNVICFEVSHGYEPDLIERFEIRVGTEFPHGHQVRHADGEELQLRLGQNTVNLAKYFDDYVPLIHFTDQAFLDGSDLVVPKESLKEFPLDQAFPQKWAEAGVDIQKESRWKNGALREESIQAFAIRKCIEEGFIIVFDDDGPNEVADIVAIKDEGNELTIRLLHCKYSLGPKAGARAEDAVEVSSQAVKTARWFWDFKRLTKRLITRNNDRAGEGAERFAKGSPQLLKKVLRLTEIAKEPKREVVIVQPGLSKGKMSPQIVSILGSADSYLRMAIRAPLTVWCSE